MATHSQCHTFSHDGGTVASASQGRQEKGNKDPAQKDNKRRPHKEVYHKAVPITVSNHVPSHLSQEQSAMQPLSQYYTFSTAGQAQCYY